MIGSAKNHCNCSSNDEHSVTASEKMAVDDIAVTGLHKPAFERMAMEKKN